MTEQTNIGVGDTVRVRHGRHEGEIATVGNITWHSNQFGSYARVYLNLEGGEDDARGMEVLEKVNHSLLIENAGHKEEGL